MLSPESDAEMVAHIARTQGRVPMSFGRERHSGVPLVLPVGREVGKSQYITISGEQTFNGILCTGGKGRGKTSGFLRRFISWMICHPQRPGALVIDVKGDLVSYLVQWARKAGREDDVVVLDPRGDFKIRLLPGELSPETLSSIIMAAVGTISGGHDKREAYWIQQAEATCRALILLVRMAEGDLHYPVSPSEICNLVGIDDAIQKKIYRVEQRYANGEYKNNPEMLHNLDYLRRYQTQQNELDQRVSTSVNSELTRSMSSFVSFCFSRTFSPGRDDKCVNISDIINEGKIIALHMPASIFADTSRMVALLIKGQYYDAVGRRMLDGSNMDRERPVYFICDEYQNFATLGGKVGADDNFAALCRYAHAGMVCCTQELGALYSVAGAGNDEVVANLVQNFQSHIFLRQDLTPRLKSLLEGKGLHELECLPKLQSFEALFFQDTDPVARLVELGPHFSSWDHVTVENERLARELKEHKQEIIERYGLLDGKDGAGMKIIIAGGRNSGKTKLLENIYHKLSQDGQCILIRGRVDLDDRPVNLIEELAKACAFSRIRIEAATVLTDDIDALSVIQGTMSNGLYVGLLPFLEGRRTRYGKYLDLVDLSRVNIIATATWHRGTGGFLGLQKSAGQLILPGLAADVFQVVDIAELGGGKQLDNATGKTEACHEKERQQSGGAIESPERAARQYP